jgi:tRNA(fMet)-specific endonuclease VapC
MVRYLLDTNALSSLVHRPSGAVGQRILALPKGAVVTSPIVLCEVQFGLEKRNSAVLNERVRQMLNVVEVLPISAAFPDIYGKLRATLETTGKPIGAMDLLIAAHALSEGATLVTANVREFSRVPGLAVENWEASEG